MILPPILPRKSALANTIAGGLPVAKRNAPLMNCAPRSDAMQPRIAGFANGAGA